MHDVAKCANAHHEKQASVYGKKHHLQLDTQGTLSGSHMEARWKRDGSASMGRSRTCPEMSGEGEEISVLRRRSYASSNLPKLKKNTKRPASKTRPPVDVVHTGRELARACRFAFGRLTTLIYVMQCRPVCKGQGRKGPVHWCKGKVRGTCARGGDIFF